MTKNLPLLSTLVFVLTLVSACAHAGPQVQMANGIKIGEVTDTRAIIWTRLTQNAERNINGQTFSNKKNKQKKSKPIENLNLMEGSTPGMSGEVRIAYWPRKSKAHKNWSAWQRVSELKDFTHQFALSSLQAGQAYSLVVEGRPLHGMRATSQVSGSFQTAADSTIAARVAFAVVTGQDYPRRDDKQNGHKIYPQMQKFGVDFFVHTGDIEYYDKPGPYADNIELARFKWNRLYAMPFQREFHNHTASYFMKDDHDTLKNDAWPGQRYGDLTWEDGLALFREQVPMAEKTYRTIRWGKDLQIWLVEGRDFRSPNTMEDGPQKTILGKTQKQWLFDTVRQSDATFKILISPTPIVGPDRKRGKNDNHSNQAFEHEGNELRAFISQQKNMFTVVGDRHWQYVSVDPATGVKEFSCGPTADAHASGFSQADKSAMHKFLRIKGGFLSAVVNRIEGVATVTMRHHGVDGGVHHQDVIRAKL